MLPEVARAHCTGRNLWSRIFLPRLLRRVSGCGPQEPASCGDGCSRPRMYPTRASDFIATDVGELDSVCSPRCTSV
jgi:hypothetical protein